MSSAHFWANGVFCLCFLTQKNKSKNKQMEPD